MKQSQQDINPDIKRREREHFGGEGIYVISLIERDRTAYERFLIRLSLNVWDRHLRYVRPEWVRDKTVLDVCCGNPRSVPYFQSMGARLAAGCDLCEAVIRRGLAPASTYVADRKLPNKTETVFVADSEQLPVPDESVDTVFIFQAIHHLDVENFLAETRRILKPGGILFISDPNGGHPLRRLGDRIGRIVRIMSADEQSLSVKNLTHSLNRHGYEVAERHSVNFLSELYFLFTVIVETRSITLANILRIGLAPLNLLDVLFENTLFRLFPAMCWRNIIVAKRK